MRLQIPIVIRNADAWLGEETRKVRPIRRPVKFVNVVIFVFVIRCRARCC